MSTGPALDSLGARLRGAGLTPRALEAWAGTARIAALPARLEAAPPRRDTPAAATLALFVEGAEVAQAELRLSGDLVDELIANDLVEHSASASLRARVAIVPLGQGLVVCDRLDAHVERELVCWPDDSSHHLTAAIPPGRRADWLELGCGSAVAPIERPELASRIAGIDINPRALRYAELGTALSGISHAAFAIGDIGAPLAPAELVTCNAPIPDRAEEMSALGIPEVWRRADRGFFERLWPALPRAVRPGGIIVVHAVSEAIEAGLEDARGERVVVSYTPAGVPGFAVAWWRPDGPDRFVFARRELSPDRPHLDARDREDALAPPPSDPC